MQVSISKAADMVGITRATLYRHIEKKGISVEQDEEGNPKIDVSELIRVYGHKVKPVIETEQAKEVSNSEHDEVVPTDDTEVTILKSKIAHLEELRELDKEASKTQNETLHSQIERLEDALKRAQEGQNKLTLLLEDKSGNKNNSWELAFKELEERIANQQSEAEEKQQKILRQNRALKRALDEEKSKSIWKKLFG